MSSLLGVRALNRSAKVRLGGKNVASGSGVTTWVNTENKRVLRDLLRHSSIAQIQSIVGPRYQLDTGTVQLGGLVTPRSASLTADVSAASLLALDGVTTGQSAAGTITIAPSATVPQVTAVGLDTSTFAVPTVAALVNNTAAGTVTREKFLQNPQSLATLPAIDLEATGSRTWLAMYWTAPAQTSTNVTGVATTGVITTAADHFLTVGDGVWFSALTGPSSGIVINTLYYVIAANRTAKTFTLSTTPGGSLLTWTGNITAATQNRQTVAGDIVDIRP